MKVIDETITTLQESIVTEVEKWEDSPSIDFLAISSHFDKSCLMLTIHLINGADEHEVCFYVIGSHDGEGLVFSKDYHLMQDTRRLIPLTREKILEACLLEAFNNGGDFKVIRNHRED
ncbi:hypothetical protein JHD46_07925 [Sulfurimonas sp. SAG-AH-194-C20]|nr:hypothetical protein [Sulfurimonas sp. SAG-AH-194-C20]MDF1879561.1 hypothetical protein [Sulfurimonas sp. SAG-AH-194-C20]